MARDRQRAKQRKARRAQNPGARLSEPRRSDLPGELEHISGEVDEFEAALVQGADGQAVEGSEDEDVETAPEQLDDEEFDELEDEVDHATLEEEAVEAAPAERRREAAAPGAPTRKGAGRFIAFLKASWAELQRVQWPDRRAVFQATAVVLGFVVIAGSYLGLMDFIWSKVITALLDL